MLALLKGNFRFFKSAFTWEQLKISRLLAFSDSDKHEIYYLKYFSLLTISETDSSNRVLTLIFLGMILRFKGKHKLCTVHKSLFYSPLISYKCEHENHRKTDYIDTNQLIQAAEAADPNACQLRSGWPALGNCLPSESTRHWDYIEKYKNTLLKRDQQKKSIFIIFTPLYLQYLLFLIHTFYMYIQFACSAKLPSQTPPKLAWESWVVCYVLRI